jgi:acetyltransferase-like isoleucine patch superfamily enzyme
MNTLISKVFRLSSWLRLFDTLGRSVGRKYRRVKYSDVCSMDPSSSLDATSSVMSDAKVAKSIIIGARTHIAGALAIMGGAGRIKIGDDSFVGPNSRIWSWLEIEIGNRVMIAHDVNIFDSMTHPVSAQSRALQYRHILAGSHPRELDLNQKKILIEDDSWIACNVVVLRGVTIGRGSIVGASSVVTKDVPPWSIVAGNPARVIRFLQTDELHGLDSNWQSGGEIRARD